MMDAFDELFGLPGAAIDVAAPIVRAPRRKKTEAAEGSSKPTTRTPPPTIADSARQFRGETRLTRARGKEAAGRTTKPRRVTPLRSKSKQEITRRQRTEPHQTRAREEGGGGHALNAIHSGYAPAADPIIDKIRQNWRMRQRWHRAEKSLILQSKAFCRAFCDGDKEAANKMFDAAYAIFVAAEDGNPLPQPPLAIMIALEPFLPAIQNFRVYRTTIERQLCKLAKQLPVWPWAEAIKGFGELSLAAIVGEAGDIGEWRTVSGLWKRFGLAVINGERQRKCAIPELAALHGYSPSRRSVMWNVGGSIIGGMGHGPRPLVGEDISGREDWTKYQKLFVERCRIEAARLDDDGNDDSRDPVISKKTGEERESYSKRAAARAKRYVEKRLLRELYAAWSKVASREEAEMAATIAPKSADGSPPSLSKRAAEQMAKPNRDTPPAKPSKGTAIKRAKPAKKALSL